MTLDLAEFRSPIGRILVAVRDGALCALEFREHWPRRHPRLTQRFGTLEFRPRDPAGVCGRLAAYFAGDLHALDALALDAGGTPFQRQVWAALRQIPPGETVSYQTLARRIGAPEAARAVGAANGANPIAIAVPCHRVIAADGRLSGYAGGVERKRWLLAHERAGTGAQKSLPL
jgi:methylated-DNA-[protein]-cysteine S-methyltransferase